MRDLNKEEMHDLKRETNAASGYARGGILQMYEAHKSACMKMGHSETVADEMARGYTVTDVASIVPHWMRVTR